MSFAVKIKNQRVVEFHRDKPGITEIGDVIWFQADGDELNTIRAQFDGIPVCRGNICTWTGELAHFIFRNLHLENQTTDEKTAS